MTLTRVRLERFTAFEELDLELSPGINVLVGANGTGKTHLMKVCYAACEVSKTGRVSPTSWCAFSCPRDGAVAEWQKEGEKKVLGV